MPIETVPTWDESEPITEELPRWEDSEALEEAKPEWNAFTGAPDANLIAQAPWMAPAPKVEPPSSLTPQAAPGPVEAPAAFRTHPIPGISGTVEAVEPTIAQRMQPPPAGPLSDEERIKEETWSQLSPTDKLLSDLGAFARATGTTGASSLKGAGTFADVFGQAVMAEYPQNAEILQKLRDRTQAQRLADREANPLVQAGNRLERATLSSFPNVQPTGVTRPLAWIGEATGSVAASLLTGPAAILTGTLAEYNDAFERELKRQQDSKEPLDMDKALAKAGAYAAGTVPIEYGLGLGRILRNVRKYFGADDAMKFGREITRGKTQKAFEFLRERAKDVPAGFSQEFSERVIQDLIVDGRPDWAAAFQEGMMGAVGQTVVGGATQATALAAQAAQARASRQAGSGRPSVVLPGQEDVTGMQMPTGPEPAVISTAPLFNAGTEIPLTPVSAPVPAPAAAAPITAPVTPAPVVAPAPAAPATAITPPVTTPAPQPIQAPTPVAAPTAQATLLEVPSEKLSLEARRKEIMRRLDRIAAIPEDARNENIDRAEERLQTSLAGVEKQLLTQAQKNGAPPAAQPPRAAADLAGLSETELDNMLDEAAGAPTAAPAATAAPVAAPPGPIEQIVPKFSNTGKATGIGPLSGLDNIQLDHLAVYGNRAERDLAAQERERRRNQPAEKPSPAPPATPSAKGAADIIADAAASGVKGIDETIKGLHDLFGGGGMGMNLPVFDEQTYAKAKPHFETAYKAFTDAGKSLQDFIKFIFDKFGAAVRPYLKRFIQDTQSAQAKDPQTKAIRALIGSNQDGRQKAHLIRKMADQFGLSLKAMQERIEAEIVLMAQEMATAPGTTPELAFAWAKALYARQPILSARTSTSVENQAYSTPIPLVFSLNQALGITPQTAIYDATGGNAALLIGGNWSASHGNEINTDRANSMRRLGIGIVTENDATKYTPTDRFPVVRLNPPFGSIPNVNYGGYSITKLEHLIALKGLEAMEDNGRAAIIIGAKMEPGVKGRGAQWIFENYLYGHYNVVGNFEVAGDLYSRQGAAWPVRVLVIDGRRVQPVGGELAAKSVDRFDNWDDVWTEANRIRNEIDRRHASLGTEGQPGIPVPAPGQPAAPGQPGRVPAPPRVPTAPTGGGGVTPGGGVRQPKAPAKPGAGDSGQPAVVPSSRPEDDPTSLKPGTPRKPTVRVETPVPGTAQPAANAPTGGTQGGGTARPGIVPRPPLVAATEFQIPYVPRSEGNPFGTLSPNNIAVGTHSALDELKNRVGPIDEFVANRLNMEVEELRNVMAAEQIDGVALAIDQIEHGGAVIIGDETGIGKGRQAAAIIRYAILNGKIPMFFTQDPKLFTDMYGDLLDINSTVKPLLFGQPAKASIVNAEGNVLHRAPGTAKQRSEMARILRDGFNESGYNAIFATYSQVNNRNARQSFLETLADSNDTIVILDEAHNAAGDAETSMQAAFMSGGRVKRGSGPDRVEITVPGLLNARGTQRGRGGVLYMSATYAKRSENMPVYFRTSLSRAADSFSDIVEAMKNGGVALQQAVSEALAKAGQYIRRERDFSGVSYSMKRVAPKDEQTLVDHVDQVTDVLSEIVRFSRRMIAAVSDAAEQSGGGFASTAQTENQTDMTDFASIVHNQVGQLLLAAKADSVVDEAIAAHKAGEKPVVALMNTMESFLDHFVEDKNIKPGTVIRLRWNELLRHALDRSLRTTTDMPDGSTQIGMANPDEFGLGELYRSIQRAADGIESNFPVSPIDYIIQKLAKAGITMHELTGRQSGIEYTNFETGEGRYIRFKKANKNTVVNRFNENKGDGMLLNASGSTGLSAHASEKFKAKEPRHMIIGQPAMDINVFVQTLGRIKRTGMVMLGKDAQGKPYGAKYTHLVLPLQAEIRPAAITARKMKSLNANTTAETDNAIKIQAEDMMNKYGDRIVAEYLDEHTELQDATGIDIDHNEDGSVKVDSDVARKFTGRMAIRPNAEQKEVYDAIIPAYNELIQRLKETGQYDLEVVIHRDWDGRLISTDELVAATDPSNIFTDGVRVQKWEVKDNRHIPTGQEMQRDFEKWSKSHADLMERWETVKTRHESLFRKKTDDLRAAIEEETAKGERGKPGVFQDQLDRLQAMSDRWDTMRNSLDRLLRDAGQVVQLNNATSGESYDGMLVEAKFPTAGLRTGASNFKLRFAINAPGGVLYLNARDFLGGEGWTKETTATDVEDLTGRDPNARYTRTFLVGNPIGAYTATGGIGKMVRFLSKDNEIITGLLMPSNWGMEQLSRDPRLDLLSGNAAAHFLRTYGIGGRYSQGTSIEALGGIVRINHTYNDSDTYVISVPAARRTGGSIYLDTDLRAITGDFDKRGNKMIVEISVNKLARVIDRIAAITQSRFRPVGRETETFIQQVRDSNRATGASTGGPAAAPLEGRLPSWVPPTIPGDHLVSLEVTNPDGSKTLKLASYNPEKFYDLTMIPKYGRKVPQRAVIVNDGWSHGLLGDNERIIEDGGASAMSVLQGRGSFGEVTPLSDQAIGAHLKKRHGIAAGNPLVEIVSEPDNPAAGWYDPASGKIQFNSARIGSTADIDWVWDHERAHLFDIENPGALQSLRETGAITAQEWTRINNEVVQSGYAANVQMRERDARVITTLADAWRKRSWFDKLVKRVQLWAGKRGIEMTRVAAERTAVRALAEATRKVKSPEAIRTARATEGVPSGQLEGRLPSLRDVKEYFTPPKAGVLPELDIQHGKILPRLPELEVEKIIASSPQGMSRVPGIGAMMDPRAIAKDPADAAFLARADSVSKGNTFAAMWAQGQWENKGLFQVDKDTGTFALANGQRGYLSDVIEAELRNPGSQPLTEDQRNWINREWIPVLTEVQQMLEDEGVTHLVTEDMEFEPETDYFPRPAIGKRNRETSGTGGKPGGKPGAKQFFQKSRKFASEAEGARPATDSDPKEVIIYDPDPISRVSKFIAGAYRAVADHRLAKDPDLGAGIVPEHWGVGRRVFAGPAFAGKVYPVAIASKIERQFAQEVRGWVRAAGTVTGAAKALMATADMSGPFIQGAAMFGRHPVRWAKATANSFRSLLDPDVMGKLLQSERLRTAAESFSQSGGSLLHLPEFLSGMKEGQIATKIPGYGRLLTATGRAYGVFLDLAKLEMFDAWSHTTEKAEWPRLAEAIENSLFMGRMEQIGMNPHRAIGERLIAFAPSYYRGAAGLISTAFQSGVSGRMARQMIGSYAAASLLVTVGALLAAGMDWDDIEKRLVPGKGTFMKVPIQLGDGSRINVGIGNILTQLVNLSAQAVRYHTTDLPIDTGVEANPYLRFLRGRAAFIPSIAIELATGRDYFGNRITAKEATARRFAPFVLQSLFPRDEAALSQRTADAAFTFFGLNAYPESAYQMGLGKIEAMSKRFGGKSYGELNIPQRAQIIEEFRRQPEYRKYDPSPGDMERIINLNDQRHLELQKAIGADQVKKLAGMGLRVPQYRTTLSYNPDQKGRGTDVPLTEKERLRYVELLAEGYRNRITALNAEALKRQPADVRETWWSKKAAEIAAESRRRLAIEIRQQKIK